MTLPIGMGNSALVTDALGERPAARFLTASGLLSTVPAAATGLSVWTDTDTDAEQRTGLVHLAVNDLATALQALSQWAHPRRPYRWGVVLGGMGVLVLGAGGWFGSHLARAHEVGVDTNAFQGAPTEWTLFNEESRDSDATVWAASADGIVLVITGNRLLLGTATDLHVLANTLPRRSIGQRPHRRRIHPIPWRRGRFDTRAGAVVPGPAAARRPVYQARSTATATEVRRHEERALPTNSVRS